MGGAVQVNQPLLTLRNPDAEDALGETQLNLAAATAEATRYRRREELGAAQAFAAKATALSDYRNEQSAALAALVVRSPMTGRVHAPDLVLYQDQHVAKGLAVLHVAQESEKKVVLSLEPKQLHALEGKVGTTLPFAIRGRGARDYLGTLSDIQTRASTTVDYQALTAAGGGPIPVTATLDGDWEYLQPRFTAHLMLSSPVAGELFAGERVNARISAPPKSIGARTLEFARQWITHLVTRVEQITG